MVELPEPEIWSNETKAAFHLNNALSEEGYRWAIEESLSMGVDPTQLNPKHLILHDEPWRDPQLYAGLAALKHKS